MMNKKMYVTLTCVLKCQLSIPRHLYFNTIIIKDHGHCVLQLNSEPKFCMNYKKQARPTYALKTCCHFKFQSPVSIQNLFKCQIRPSLPEPAHIADITTHNRFPNLKARACSSLRLPRQHENNPL